MDNQQERLAHVGGLITGEGCFSLNVVRANKRGAVISPTFSLFMTDKESVETAYLWLREAGIPCYMETRKKSGNYRDQYGIRAGGVKRCKRFCEGVIPYLMGEKRKAAENLLAFINHRMSGDCHMGYSPIDIDFLKRQREINAGYSHRYPIDQLAGILRDYTPCPS